MLVLDTNHLDVLMFEHERREKLVARLNTATGHTVATTIIVVQEKLQGWLSIINGKNMAATNQVPYYAKLGHLIRFFERWNILPFDEACAIEFDRLKALRLGGLGSNDLKIAAIVLHHKGILLSADGGFRKIPGLVVEDWLADNLEQ